MSKEQGDNYVDLGYGIPRYAVMETLRTMCEKATKDAEKGYDRVAECSNGFHIADKRGFDLSLLANCCCVGLAITCLEITDITEKSFKVHFDIRRNLP